MTVLSTFSRIQITGLTGGVWSRGIDINALSAIPSGTTHAIIQLETNSSGASWGVGNFEEVSTFTSGSVARGDQVKFIPLGASQDLDFYLSNTTNGKWFLIGYTDHITAITPVDKYASVTGTGTYTIDCSADLPSDAVNGWALIDISKLAKIGAVGATSAQYKSMAANKDRIHVIVPLNASRQFEISGSAAMTAGQLRILGWMPTAAYQGSSDPSTNRYAHSGVAGWEELGYTSNTALDHWRISNAGTTSASPTAQISEMRPSGDTSFSRTDINGEIGHRFVVPNGSGKIQSYSIVAGVYYTWYGGFVANTAAPAILSIDTFVEGATATITLDTSVASFTSLAIKGADEHIITVSSFSGSGDTWTFTVPPITDEVEGLRIGDVLINPTTSGGVGEEYSDTYSKASYTFVELEDVLSGNLGEVVSADPAFKSAVLGVSLGTQVAYKASEVTIDVHGLLTWAADGTHDIYYYDPDDFKWRLITITSEVGAMGLVVGQMPSLAIGYGIGI